MFIQNAYFFVTFCRLDTRYEQKPAAISGLKIFSINVIVLNTQNDFMLQHHCS